jgi:hypothetical protein
VLSRVVLPHAPRQHVPQLIGSVRRREKPEMPISTRQVLALLVIGASLACVSRGALNAPRRLMVKKYPATWATIDTQTTTWGDHDCSSQSRDQLFVAHESGRLPISFGLRVIGRSTDGKDRPVDEATVWLREPFSEYVVRITLGPSRSVLTFENGNTFELEEHELQRDADGFTQISLALKTSGYPDCEHGHVVKSIATYPQGMLVTAPGCHDVFNTIDSAWRGARIVELRCGAASPNSAVKLPVHAVTGRAVARPAPARPAAYGERWADKSNQNVRSRTVIRYGAALLASCSLRRTRERS